jgi:predicted transcriptional regulator
VVACEPSTLCGRPNWLPRDKGITATDIAKMLGVSRATVYRYLGSDESVSA